MEILYGGSFNPPTIAHYQIAKYIIEMFPDDDFYFLPASDAYEKENLSNSRHRVEMLRILCEKLPGNARVSTFELELNGYKGTAFTLDHFLDPCFVMGADNLKTIDKWIRYPEVVWENKFIIVPRGRINLEALFEENEILKNNRNHFMILDKFHKLYISSTKYRKTKNNKYLLPEVADYIEKNRLYKEY